MPMGSARPVRYHMVPMQGGLDLVTPTLTAPPGILRDNVNFEVSPIQGGGYTRIHGYERFDGQASPSDATYFIVQVSVFTNTPTPGQTLTGGTSGATGVIVGLGGDFMILTKAVGTFTTSEAVLVGATPIGTAVPSTTQITTLQNAQYLQLAADNYRADILEVPGSGPVLGVVSATFSGSELTYAFRNNAGGTFVDLYKSSGSGWVNVPMFREVSFTAGAIAAPADGATVTQGANTALIKRVILESGSWAGASAAGRLVIAAPAPGEFAAGAATIGATTLTLSGASTAITIAIDGTYEFVIHNFAGQAGSIRIYGCDGANRAFEFDGTTYAPIVTGLTVDTPTHITVNRQHLFLGAESSIFHSAPGEPFRYSGAGTSEIAVGDFITNFLRQPGTSTGATLAVTTRSNTVLIYGTVATDWNVVPMNVGIGGIERTAQLLNQSYWLDTPGLVNMYTSQNYGNFGQSTMTTSIQPFIEEKRTKVVASVLSRSKNQYRLLFNDGSALYSTIVNGKLFGHAKVLYLDVMHCAWSSMTTIPDERVFCGAEDSGFVYRMDRGPSFDGEPIFASMTLNWDNFGSPRVRKRMRRLSIEMQSNYYAKISYGYSFSYRSLEATSPPSLTYTSGTGGAPIWDLFTWDFFTWDGAVTTPTEVLLEGTAENIQSVITSAENYIYPYTVNSLLYHYSDRRGLR